MHQEVPAVFVSFDPNRRDRVVYDATKAFQLWLRAKLLCGAIRRVVVCLVRHGFNGVSSAGRQNLVPGLGDSDGSRQILHIGWEFIIF